MHKGGPAENIEWIGLSRFHCYLHKSGERLQLLSHGLSQSEAEKLAFDWLIKNSNTLDDSTCGVVTSLIIEDIEIGDFIMRGPTPDAI